MLWKELNRKFELWYYAIVNGTMRTTPLNLYNRMAVKLLCSLNKSIQFVALDGG